LKEKSNLRFKDKRFRVSRVSVQVSGLIKVSGFMNPIDSKEEFSCKIEIYFYFARQVTGMN
jgi:hypothetical protein